jgi:hypothetical protein
MMRIVAASLCLCANACAFGPQLTRVAVNQNDLVANSSNELLMTNILRARDREPLHFTSVGALHGDASFEGTAGSNIALSGVTRSTEHDASGAVTKVTSGAATDVTTPTVGLTASGTSSMDVTVWDTQDFYQGITASVPPGTIAHYLHQGWPADLLTYLFVSSVDFLADEAGPDFKKGDLLESFNNEPDATGAAFSNFVACYRLTYLPKADPDVNLVRLDDLKGNLKLSDLAILDGDKFDITAGTDKDGKPVERWITRKGHSGDTLALRTLFPYEAQTCDANSSLFLLSSSAEQPRTPFQGQAAHSIVASGTLLYNGRTVKVQVQVVLRSIDGVIYYLGEYLRQGDSAPRLVVSGVPLPIVYITTTRPQRVFATARFKGDRYYAPATYNGQLDSTAGRTSQVFTLVEQLLNLQKSGKDRPSTQTVRIVE